MPAVSRSGARISSTWPWRWPSLPLSMVGTLTGTYGDRYGARSSCSTSPSRFRWRCVVGPLLTFLTVLAMIVARALLLGDLEGGGVFFSLIVGGYSLGAHAPLRPRAGAASSRSSPP